MRTCVSSCLSFRVTITRGASTLHPLSFFSATLFIALRSGHLHQRELKWSSTCYFGAPRLSAEIDNLMADLSIVAGPPMPSIAPSYGARTSAFFFFFFNAPLMFIAVVLCAP